MLNPFNDIKMMGVINITPDSFSDAASLFLKNEELINKLHQFKKIPDLIYDFGFESTAPMNSSISIAEEQARFDHVFETLSEIDLSGKWISFDTYKPESYRIFEAKFKEKFKDCGYIFNDVSGILDDEVLNFLETKKDQEDFYYVLGSTHIPSRDLVLKHINYIQKGDIVKQTIDHFLKGIKKLESIGLKNKIILDPCFGFSKTYDQNWELINRFSELVQTMNHSGHHYPMIIGISKKSFLRSALPESSNPFNDSEILHAKIIKEIISKKCGQLIWRAHDPFLVESVYSKVAVQS